MEVKTFEYKAKQVCTRCIMDDTVQGIAFDENGVCTFCHIHDEIDAKYPLDDNASFRLQQIINKIKKKGRKKKYDCIVGISGGKDSSYTLIKVVELGLRPLVVHFDNGWNSDHAVQNIKKICEKLNLDLYTHVADWEEFKDLQKSFLYASVPDGEVPTDWVISSVLFKIAYKEKIKYIIGGNSFRTEGTTPLTWTYQDPKYINDIHKKFGNNKIKSFPIMSSFYFFYFTIIKRIKWIRILYYMPYNEQEAIDYLIKNYGWENYGGKHFESNYTKFFQSYILTRKFNIDKRKLHYSALIRSKQMTREDAMDKIKLDPYDGGKDMIYYNLKKLDLSELEFERIMNELPKNFLDYLSYYNYIKKFKKMVLFLNKIGIVPHAVIQKYFRFNY